MHFTLHAAPFDAFLPADVGTVSIELLTSIIFIDQDFEFLRIVSCSITNGIGTDEFGAMINLDVVLVAVEAHLVLLDPVHMTVFLAQFVWLCLPCFWGLSLFDLLVFVMAIALFGYFNKGGIDNLARLGKDALIIKRLIETVKQGFDDSSWINVSQNF